MFSAAKNWKAHRMLRLFADRCTAHVRNERQRTVVRSAVLKIAEERQSGAAPLCLDPRFRLRVELEDIEEHRLEYILDQFNGLSYSEELQFPGPLERRLMACHQNSGLRFHWKRPFRRASVSIRLIDTTVGFGVFADRDLEEGEVVGEYAGFVSISESVADRTYCYEYPALHYAGEETSLVVDAARTGNETRFINHALPEVVTHSFEFFNGHWRVPFTVNCGIEKDEQLFIDYGSGYWEGQSRQPLALSSREIPPDEAPGEANESGAIPDAQASACEEVLAQPHHEGMGGPQSYQKNMVA